MDASATSPWTGRLRWLAYALILAGLLLLLKALPVDALVRALTRWIESLGFWGPAIFAALYAVWATALLPAAALTLVGGAVFGLAVGTAAVWSGAVVAMALSFLIARYAARERVERMARANPKFGAIDRAIGQGGWKIVAMLRLSPAVPFNLQNYLYGLTPIRFWPCVLTSAVAILPGTFLYTYLGHVAGQGLQAAGGGEGRPPAQWALLGVGLLATLGVTVYVTKLARRALAEQAGVAEQAPATPNGSEPASPRSPVALLSVAGALFALGLFAYVQRDWLQGAFGPPQVVLREAYEHKADGPDLDHMPFDRLLAAYVDERGLVDYEGLREREADLDAYLLSLSQAPFDAMGRNQKLALLLNAYNAFTLELILDHWPVDSITHIPAPERWDAVRWNIAGKLYSLNQIEHEQIRPKFAEPRIHFALVCAAMGCPKLRNEAYEPELLEEQLEEQAWYVHSHDTWFRFDAAERKASLTLLYQWYAGDFEQAAGSSLAFAARYAPELAAALEKQHRVSIEWLDYDWSLNRQGGATQ
ncbi:MAG: DUF547 domain-containing protein [Acidobacteria bacterium]|nr:DUF547 domain-containing protein [Acidobacteriota bacterium]